MAVALTEHERLFTLPREIWLDIYERLGMVNRFVSAEVEGQNFVLWTTDGHRIVFAPEKET